MSSPDDESELHAGTASAAAINRIEILFMGLL